VYGKALSVKEGEDYVPKHVIFEILYQVKGNERQILEITVSFDDFTKY